jgi:hypothetical protein
MSSRRFLLEGQTQLNGIDFVEVDASQTRLRVHFVNAIPDEHALSAWVKGVTIQGGETIAEVPALFDARVWSSDSAGRPILELQVAAPGDFSNYVLSLVGPVAAVVPLLDPYFDHATFSFKASCQSTLDCRPGSTDCPTPPDCSPPIDYLAKDFQSFRKALSDFSRLRYPDWQERSEADFGVMFMEALSSLADDLSYQQDRIAAEGWLETATERRSLLRLARLVDYEPRVATIAHVWLQFDLQDLTSVRAIPTGTLVSGLSPDGTSVDYEVGTGLGDLETGYSANPAWNRGKLLPFYWDDDAPCLPRGSTEMYVLGWDLGLCDGQLLLIDTPAVVSADPPWREIVRIVGAPQQSTDLLRNQPVTRIAWRVDDALQFDHDLSRTTLAGNVVPATEGRRHIEAFVIPPSDVVGPAMLATRLDMPQAIVRTGTNRSLQFLYSLKYAPLAWMARNPAVEKPRPELILEQATADGPRRWDWRRTMLQADPFTETFTVEPMSYREIDIGTGMFDYDGDDGDTLRFGDGQFGPVPGDGAQFLATYRTGGGTRGQLAAETINSIDPACPIASEIKRVSNPLAASGASDAETPAQIREFAPQAFRAIQYRAVRAEDFDRAAEQRLDWVQRAGTRFRYTGSWLSAFTAVDPIGSQSLDDVRMLDLERLLARYRMAGQESFGFAPRYASLDLQVTVCARPDAFGGEVERALLAALGPSLQTGGRKGFFHPDRFTFGMALERSALEAAVQEVPGVGGVLDVTYRRRGYTRGFVRMLDSVSVAPDEIIRLENDPSRPERGSLRVEVRGGK